jgi:hypothetical protein
MVSSVFTSTGRRLSVAMVLTLVLFGAGADLQPASALASPAERADVVVGASYLEDDNNGNHDDNENRDKDNNNEDRNHDDNGNNNDENNNDEHRNHENAANIGGAGIFSLICSVPGFANNVGCSSGLLGN